MSCVRKLVKADRGSQSMMGAHHVKATFALCSNSLTKQKEEGVRVGSLWI